MIKLSTPDSPKPYEPKSILLIGPPGGGKSSLAMQIPGIEFKDIDRNLDGCVAQLRKVKREMPFFYDQVCLKDDGSPLEVERCFDVLIESLSRKSESKAICIDSLTIVNELIIRKVLGAQNRDTVEIRDWMKIKSHYLTLLVAKGRSIGKTFICTVHEDKDTVANAKNPMLKDIVGYSPSLTGSIADQIGGFFTDVWRCYAERDIGTSLSFRVAGWPTPMSPYLKNSFGFPDKPFEIKHDELVWDKLKPYCEGKL